MHALLDCFGEASHETETYANHRPNAIYLRNLLASENFIALAALHENLLVRGLAAYELIKFEQQRSEIYIYDLAVSVAYRRQGVASALIETLQQIATDRGAWIIFVQADYGDNPAIQLYSKLDIREDVMHFDIPVPGASSE